MSRLAPGLIELNKGLNLNTAKIAAPEGTLLDSLNYEQVDFQGQKRIDGYVRYDGSRGSYLDDFLRINVGPGYSTEIGSALYLSPNGELSDSGALFGIVVGFENDLLDLAVIDETLIAKLRRPHSWATEGSQLTPDEHYELILQYNKLLRDRATELPGPVAGLHWFRDRLFAVASVPVVRGTGVYPNETYNGFPVLKVADGLVYLGTEEIVGTEPSDMASFFMSRTEAQAIDELGEEEEYGWKFTHQGWRVPFENGVSAYGKLPSLNQNIQGIGIQGPTSTQGGNGRPLAVLQKATIAGAAPQVNGWKLTESRSTYSLKEEAIWDNDSSYIYADAFVSWDGETGEVQAPGLDSLTIPEYSPTNTVILTEEQGFVD